MADNSKFVNNGMSISDINNLSKAQDKYNGTLNESVNIANKLKLVNEDLLEQSKKAFEQEDKNKNLRFEDSAEYLAVLSKIRDTQLDNIDLIIKLAEVSKLRLDYEDLAKAYLEKAKTEADLLKTEAVNKAQANLDFAKTLKSEALIKKAEEKLAEAQSKDYKEDLDSFKLGKAFLDAYGPKERSNFSQFTSDPKLFLKTLAENKTADKLNELNAKLATAKTDEDREKIVTEIQDVRDKTSGIISGIEGLGNIFNKIGAKLASSITETTNVYKQYMGTMNARLQGTGKTFVSLNDTIANAYSTNALVSLKSLIDNVASLTNEGIMYNVEERALLNALGDKLISTFEVTNASLTSLIRIQQADLTQSQLGVETALNRFLNSNFLDSSYLNSIYDSVTSAILEANAQLDYQQTADFSYAVQKWLGSLYSVGVDQGTVTNIASGLNALATGDISKISGNVLFTASAANAGLDLAEMMTNGIDSADINKLMTSMVQYLQQIAKSTADNNITRQAYSNILDVSISDIAAILNLSSSMINTIASTNMTYEDTMNETAYLLSQVASRTTIAEKIDNALENVMYTWGMNISDSALNYALWRGGDLVSNIGTMFGGDKITGSLAAQGIVKAGNYMQLTSGVLGLLNSLKSYATSLGANGAGINNLAMFDWDQTVLARGGDNSGLSYSGLIKSTSTKSSKTLADNIVEANTIALNEEAYTKTADDLYTALFVDNKAVHVYVDDINKDAIDLSSVNAIKNKLEDGTIKVDVADNDINSLTNALMTLRTSF